MVPMKIATITNAKSGAMIVFMVLSFLPSIMRGLKVLAKEVGCALLPNRTHSLIWHLESLAFIELVYHRVPELFEVRPSKTGSNFIWIPNPSRSVLGDCSE
jgi:hypothetical protein